MDAREAVRQLKQEMGRYATSGEASRLRGIIVTPEVYQALREESEDFHDVMGVSGREGNRSIRYSFFVLENPSFPKRSGLPYFFVGASRETYIERFLGREEEILSAEDRPEVVVGGERRSVAPGWSSTGDQAKITCMNPITGVVLVEMPQGTRYFYLVDFDEVINAARQAVETGRSIEEALTRFDKEVLINNPPETRWIKDEATYNYAKADMEASVGRLLMQRPEIRDKQPRKKALYQIVGIGKNGLGQIIPVLMQNSQCHDPYQFACVAVHYFLPEEVADFLSQCGISITPEWVAQIPVKELWGVWHDPDALGRLTPCHWENGRGEKIYAIQSEFVGTRAKVYILELISIPDEKGWREVQSQHFPPQWRGWPKTDYDKRVQKFAQAIA